MGGYLTKLKNLEFKNLKERAISSLKKAAPTILGIILAFVVGGVITYLLGYSPVGLYKSLLEVLTSQSGIVEILVKTTPLLLVGLGIVIAFKAKFWNIGAEGQLIIGAILTTWVALNFNIESKFLFVPILLAVGAIGGCIWALLPSVLKTKLGINEIVVTVLMNYIAILLLNYLVRGPLQNPNQPAQFSFPESATLPTSAHLPFLIGSRLHIGILIAIFLVAVVYIFLQKTPRGFEIRAVGTQPDSAEYSGISTWKSMLLAGLLSGMFAGLAGSIEIMGVHHRLLDHISAGYGFFGIVAALLGKLKAAGTIFGAVFFAFLIVGLNTAQRAVGIPAGLAYMLQGLILILILSGEYLLPRWG